MADIEILPRNLRFIEVSSDRIPGSGHYKAADSSLDLVDGVCWIDEALPEFDKMRLRQDARDEHAAVNRCRLTSASVG